MTMLHMYNNIVCVKWKFYCILCLHIEKSPLIGDMVCVGAGFCGASVIVGEEFLIKGKMSMLEFMAMLSFSGAIIAGIQLYVIGCIHSLD